MSECERPLSVPGNGPLDVGESIIYMFYLSFMCCLSSGVSLPIPWTSMRRPVLSS